MDPKSLTSEAAGTPDATPTPGLIENIAALWAELRGSVHDHLQIAGLEAQRAALNLVWMAACGTVVGMLVAATWLAAAGALVLWFIDSGLNASAALLLGATLNLLGAFGFVLLLRRKSQALRFPATLRGLDPDNLDAAPDRAQADT